MTMEEAVERTIHDCIKEGILVDILSNSKAILSQIFVTSRYATKIKSVSNVCRYWICDSSKGRVQIISGAKNISPP